MTASAYFGVMPATVSNSYEWNGVEGTEPDMMRLGNSEYYLIAYSSGVGGHDGYVNTSKVENDTGVIQTSTVDSLDYDTGTVYYPNIVHVSGDIYAISAGCSAGNPGKIRTIKAWESNGSIYPNTAGTYIATKSFTYPAYYNDIVQVSGNMFVVAYSNQTWTQGWLQSFWINNTGTMFGSTFNDTVCFNTSGVTFLSLVSIDSNTIGLVYCGISTNYDGYLATYDVSASTGDISNVAIESWEFDTTMAYIPTIKHVSGDVYAIAYGNTNSDIFIGSVTISSAGDITTSWIDSLTIIDTQAHYPTLFTVNDMSVYGVTYKSAGDDGFMKTFNMSSDGTIGAAVIDSLEFDATDCMYWTRVSWVNKSYYYIVYTGTGSDGWSCVVNITTNYGSPVLSTPQPTDGATNVHSAPWCNITVADIDTSIMTVSWFSNYTGSWVHYQTNSSCANGTYRWHFTGANIPGQKYWWRVYANDGLHNTSSSIYSFTLETGAAWSNRVPTFGTPSPANSSTNVHRYCFTNLTIYDLDGNDTLVCFWYSLSDSPYSWVKAQQNATITANTTAKDINASYAHIASTHYWWKITAEDEFANSTSNIFNFWTQINESASTFIVAKTGTDGVGHAGTLADPFLTIQYAIHYRAINPGDTVYVRQGDYNENIYMYYSGTTGNPITISGYPGETAVINGTGISLSSGYGLIMLSSSPWTVGRKYITIQNIAIENSTAEGIGTIFSQSSPCNNITVKNCSFNNIWSRGVSMWQTGPSTYPRVCDILIDHCTFDILQASNDIYNECNSFSGVHRLVIHDCYLTRLHHTGFCFANGTSYVEFYNNRMNITFCRPDTEYESGIYICSMSARSTRLNISNNMIWGNQDGIRIAGEGASGKVDNVTIWNNIINSTAPVHGSCIDLRNESGTNLFDILIKYNTLYHGGYSTSSSPFYINIKTSLNRLHNLIVTNNILCGTVKFLVYCYANSNDPELHFYNNLYYRFNGTTRTAYQDMYDYFEPTAIKSNPLFVNRNIYNFHLNQSSPAIDAASATYAVSSDYDGTYRPIYGGYDIGAFEYNNGTPIITNIYPQNGSVGIPPLPQCAVTVTDFEGDTMDVRWYAYIDGVWVLKNTNATVTNGTYRWTFPEFDTLSMWYYWSVNVTDGTNYLNNSYHFYCGDMISIHNPSPVDMVTNVNPTITRMVNATVTCHNGKEALAYIWYFDALGVYHAGSSSYVINVSVSGTIVCNQFSYTFTWGINAVNETNMTNQSFTFTTGKTLATGDTVNCNNEYYSVTTPLTFNLGYVSANWVSFNGIGFNISYAGTKTYENFSSIKSNPSSSVGYILNWTSTRIGGGTIYYNLSGLKSSHDYILYANGVPFAETSNTTGVISWSSVSASRVYQLYDEGSPETWYVSLPTNTPPGSDVTGTGSIAAPFATLRKAITASTTSDTIIIRGGDYTQMGWDGYGTILINRSGTKTDPFTIRNYTGEKVIIDGKLKSITPGYGMFRLYKWDTNFYNNITIIGLNFSNCSGDAIYGSASPTGHGACNDIIIDDCEFYNITKRAIYFYNTLAPSPYIQNVTASNCTFNKIQTNASTGECVTFMGCKNFVFENNSMKEYHKQGVSCGGSGSCYGNIRYNTFKTEYYFAVKMQPYVYGDKSGHHVNIYNNLFYGNVSNPNPVYSEDGVSCIMLNPEDNDGYLHNISIYNNIINITTFNDKYCHGINICAYSETGVRMENIMVEYNTVYLKNNDESYNFRLNEGSSKCKDIIIANNIFVNDGNATNQVWTDLNKAQTNFSLINNCYWDTDGSVLGERYFDDSSNIAASNIADDPETVDLTAGDFHLNNTSPMIGAASATYTVGADYEGAIRPQGTGYDIGAYEHPFSTPATPSFIFSSEVPTNTTTGIALTPDASINIHETHGYKFNVTLQENTTGVWVTRHSSNDNTNSTLVFGYAQAAAYSTKYWWRASAVNGTTYHNETYYFTTVAAPAPSFTFTGISPGNMSTDRPLTPTVSVTINEIHGYSFNYTIQENKSVPGTWTELTSADNVNNGTYSHIYHPATDYSTKYWWRVTSVNGTTWKNATYSFTTTAPALPVFIFSGETPGNESTGISKAPTLYVTMNETHGYRFNYTIKGNATGSWLLLVYGNDTLNFTASVMYANANGWSHTYWWRVSALNGTTYHNVTYHFMTLAQPTPVFTITGITPVNTSTGITPMPLVYYTINESHGYKFNFTVKENATGWWQLLTEGYNFNNHSGIDFYVHANAYSHKYYWRICAVNGTTWHNETYWFTTESAPLPLTDITVEAVKANWTTSTSVYLSWTKGTNCTNTHVYRSNTGYLNGAVLLYSGTNAYYNNTFVSPTTRYFYTLYPYNSVSGLFGTPVNITLAETDNTTSYGASWLDFKGYLITNRTVGVRYEYADNAAFTSLSTNTTTYQTGYKNVTGGTYGHCSVYNLVRTGQVFKTNSSRYYIYNVTLKLSKTGDPGPLYCYLYSANTSIRLPSGAILSSGYLDTTDIVSGNWYNISMSPYYPNKNTYYAIVLYCSGALYNRIDCYTDNLNSTPYYPYGQWFYSVDGGATYQNQSELPYNYDVLFKVWGRIPTTTAYGANTSYTSKSSSGTIITRQMELQPGQVYYYRLKANDTEGNMTRGNTRYGMTNPDAPVFLSITPSFDNSSLHITWIVGIGAERTLIVQGIDGYPEDYTDGETIDNLTGASAWLHNISFNISYHFALFSYATETGLHRYSTGSTVPWGGISFNCYNESSGLPIGYSILVSDRGGNHVYYGPDLMGWQFINTTEIPLGARIGFYVSNSSGLYNPRMYYYSLLTDVFYNFSFYLPMAGTPPSENTSYLYNLNVYEVVESDAYTSNIPVADVNIIIKRYMVTTDSFVVVASLLTDSSGVASVNLYPYVLYKIFLNKTGYYNVSGDDYVPDPPNEWGQTQPKSFKMIRISPSEGDVENYTTPETRWTNIVWSIEPRTFYHNSSFNVYFNITSSDNKLEWYSASLYVYNSSNITWVLLFTQNNTNSGGGSISFTVPNIMGKYSFECMFKKQNFSVYHFGASDGCRFYFISLSPLEDIASSIPDLIYLIVMIFLMIAAIAFLVKFGAGAMSGIGGLCVMGLMIAIKPSLTVGSPGVSAWWMFAATCVTYLIVLFISRGRT